MKLIPTLVLPGLLLSYNSYKQTNSVHPQDKNIQVSQSLLNNNNSLEEQLGSDDSSSPSKGKYQFTYRYKFEGFQFVHSPYWQIFKEVALFSALGVSSFYFAKHMKNITRISDLQRINFLVKQLPFGLEQIKQYLLKNVQTVDLSSRNLPDQQLIYGQGNVNVQLLNNKSISDPLFGVQTNITSTLGLRRQVQIYDKENEKWISPNRFQQKYPQLAHTCMQQVWFLPDQVKLNEFEIFQPQYQRLINYGESYLLQLNPKQVDDNYQQLVEKYQTLSYNPKQNQIGQDYIYLSQKKVAEEVADLSEQYQNHPFTFATQFKKQIVFDSNYIYIATDVKNYQDGDIRISFQQLIPFLQASIITHNSGENLIDSTLNVLNKQPLSIDLNIGGKYNQFQLKDINFIKKGLIGREQLIDAFLQQISFENDQLKVNNGNKTYKESQKESRSLIKIIFIIYILIASQLELKKLKWGVGLTAMHLATTMSYSFGIINQLTLAGLLTTGVLLTKLYSQCNKKIKIEKEDINKKQDENLCQIQEEINSLKEDNGLSKEDIYLMKMIELNQNN